MDKYFLGLLMESFLTDFQGSILGPLLYHINDINSVVQSSVFAVDISLIYVGRLFKTSRLFVQHLQLVSLLATELQPSEM